jgi:hypothetical protein
MRKPAKVDPDKITLLKIITLKGNIDIVDEFSLLTTLSKYSFDFNTESRFQREQKLVRLYLEISIKCYDEDNDFNGITADYTHEFVFEVDNMEELVTFDDERRTATAENDLGLTLASIAYSTARGIIFDRTQGTPLNGVILPVINPNELISTKNL